jgi:hydrophobe/amphiphile efflux-3 (HAE3) family protein
VNAAARALSVLAAGAARRPRLVLALALALGLGGAALALRLRPSAATSTFVSTSSSTYEETQRFYRSFGEEPVAVLVKGDLQQLLLSSDIDALVGLEGCLSGNVPASALASVGGRDGPCGQLARAKAVKVVLGPGTFIEEAASQIDEQLAQRTRQAQEEAGQAQAAVRKAALARGLPPTQAEAFGRQASKITLARFEESLARIALQYGLTSPPSLHDASFVTALVFDSTKPAGTPKQRFAYLFPGREAALVSVRLKAGLSQARRDRTIALIRQALGMPQWRLQHGAYLLTGEPVIVSELSRSITHSLELLLVAVLVVMSGALALIFTGRPRLLPLALALLAAAIAFGALSLAGASLTMASIAVLPVLVGLAVDYCIQFQSRVQEQEDASADDDAALTGPAAGAPVSAGRIAPASPERIARASAAGAPTLAAAATASAAAMLALTLSPVPMVRGFGVLLVLGVAVALLCAITVGSAAIALGGRPFGGRPLGGRSLDGGSLDRGTLGERSVGVRPFAVPRGRGGRAAGELARAWRGARELLVENPLARALMAGALLGAVRRPRLALAVGLVLALAGWGLDTQTQVQTDIAKLVPQSLPSLQSLNALERSSGVGGEVDVMLSGRALATPRTIEWMSSYQRAVLRRFGYGAGRGCGRAQVCPAFSLPDLFGQGHTRGKLTQAQVSGLLAAIPPYFSQDVISADRRTATLAFGIRLMALDRQQQVIERMRSLLHPPKGVSATLVGLPVLAAQSGAQLADPLNRLWTLLAGLGAVALVLALVFRGRWRRVLVPLVPVALATGWSALVLFLLRVPLNPMSVTLSALVIAISTEFSVLLSERHRQERAAGHETIEALRRAYARTGAAVGASAVTAIAGFGVLALSDIRMLRDFGLVTLVDLTVSVLGVLLALPATLVLASRAQRSADSSAPGGGRPEEPERRALLEPA